MYEYPYGDNQQLNLDWFLTEFKNLVAAWEAEKAGIDGALDDEIARAEAALADVFAARDAAAASATAAAGSASSAGTSATAAGNSATAAAASATLANNKAAAAGLSEANAAQSASNASASETTASNAATAAAASATQAAASASGANTDATAAAGSATAAAASATQAAASAARAEEVEESIPEDYSALNAEVETFLLAQYPTIYCPFDKLCVAETNQIKVNRNIITAKIETVPRLFLTGQTPAAYSSSTPKTLKLEAGTYVADFCFLNFNNGAQTLEQYIYLTDIGLQNDDAFYRMNLQKSGRIGLNEWYRSASAIIPQGEYSIGVLWSSAFWNAFGESTFIFKLEKI